MLRQLFQGLSLQGLSLGLLRHLPSQCAVCRTWPAQAVCEACVGQFAQPVNRCHTCALPLPALMRQCGACIRTPPPMHQALAAVTYAYPWSRLVGEFKFHAHTGWAKSFATLMRSTPWVEPALEAADLVLAMPLSNARLRQRGFNQAQLLAHALEPQKTVNGVLLRILDTPPQSTLPRKDRLQNVQHAFAVDPLQMPLLKGKRIVLVDDVMTSGASQHAAATVLRRAGVQHIAALVFARTQ
jgi:ComF family protein